MKTKAILISALWVLSAWAALGQENYTTSFGKLDGIESFGSGRASFVSFGGNNYSLQDLTELPHIEHIETYDIQWGEKKRYYPDYNNDGELVRMKKTAMNGASGWSEYSLYTSRFSLNEDGLLTSAKTFKYTKEEENPWFYDSISVIYNSQGLPESSIFEFSDGEDTILRRSYKTYGTLSSGDYGVTYDSTVSYKSRDLQPYIIELRGNEVENYERHFFSSANTITINGIELHNISEYTTSPYTFDTAFSKTIGDTIKELKYTISGDLIEYIQDGVEYDTVNYINSPSYAMEVILVSGDTVKKCFYRYEDGLYMPHNDSTVDAGYMYEEKYLYGANNEITCIQNFYGGESLIFKTSYYSRDYVFSGDEFQTDTIYNYQYPYTEKEYDNAGRLIKTLNYHDNGFISENTTTYAGDSSVVKAYRTVDANGNEIEKGKTEYRYTYDADGNPLKADYVKDGVLSSTVSFKYRAEVTTEKLLLLDEQTLAVVFNYPLADEDLTNKISISHPDGTENPLSIVSAKVQSDTLVIELNRALTADEQFEISSTSDLLVSDGRTAPLNIKADKLENPTAIQLEAPASSIEIWAAGSALYVSGPEAIEKLQIITASGTIAMQQQLNAKEAVINLSQLSSGAYIVQVIDSHTNTASQNIIIN